MHTPDAARPAAIDAPRLQATLSDPVVQALFAHAPVAAAVLAGPDHIVQLANPRFLQLTGADRLAGRCLAEALPAVRQSPLLPMLAQVLQQGQPVPIVELTLAQLCGGATDRHAKLELEPLRGADGSVQGVVIVAVEATLEVRARHALEQARHEQERLLAELKAATRARHDFLTMLGRELRSPLGPIVHALELMRLRGGAQAHGEELGVIERQVQQLVQLADQVLRAGIGHDETGLRPEPVNVAHLFARATEGISALLQQRHLRLSVRLSSDQLHCLGEEAGLAQLLGHLLHNAVRFTPPGGHIELAGWEQAGEVVLRVRDDGVGIAPEVLGRVWQPFFQGAPSPHAGDTGLGMGLALVKSLVALHHGTVAAFSDGPGKGAEFVVRLPGLQPVAPAPTAGSTEPRPLRILVVDDHADGAHSLAQLLTLLGHEVVAVTDPLQAEAAAQQLQPEVGLLDIGMPHLNGYQLLRRLRQHPWSVHCRFIAITAYGEDADRQHSLEAGFEHHLKKPVMIDALKQVLAAEPLR